MALEDELKTVLSKLGAKHKLESLTVWHLDEPSKDDPLNLRSVMTAKATVEGKSCAWIVDTLRQRRDKEDLIEVLIKGLADEIRAKPSQVLGVGAVSTTRV
jgi:hypothetical protein